MFIGGKSKHRPMVLKMANETTIQRLDEVGKVLIELSLSELTEKFSHEEKIDISILAAASDDDQKRLIVKCLDDRIRI